MGEIINVIKIAMIANTFTIICVMSCIIVTMAIIINDSVKRKNRYVIWKKQTLNFGIYSREWERTDDVVLQQLFDENQRLETENKSLKKQKSKLSFLLLIGLFGSLFTMWLLTFKSKKTKEKDVKKD